MGTLRGSATDRGPLQYSDYSRGAFRSMRKFAQFCMIVIHGAFHRIAHAYRLCRSFLILAALILSLLVNVAAFSTGMIASVVSKAVEVATGATTVSTRLQLAESRVSALTDDLASTKAAVDGLRQREAAAVTETAKARAERQVAKRELEKVQKTAASQLEGTIAGKNLVIERERAARVAAEKARDVALKSGKRVVVEGIEMSSDEAVLGVTRRMRSRAAKWAAADLGATIGQAIPWIGVGVVVAATTYDLNNTCETMKDARTLELAFNPQSTDDADVSTVCGMKVPSAEEVWIAVERSPEAAWQAAARLIPDLSFQMPEMPEIPAFDWRIWN